MAAASLISTVFKSRRYRVEICRYGVKQSHCLTILEVKAMTHKLHVSRVTSKRLSSSIHSFDKQINDSTSTVYTLGHIVTYEPPL